jgi:hypothetical protein
MERTWRTPIDASKDMRLLSKHWKNFAARMRIEMSNDDNDHRVTSAFERHAQTSAVMLLVALLLWVGNTTQNTAVAVAEMRVEMVYLKATMNRPDPQFAELSKRIDTLAGRVSALEFNTISTANNTKKENR